MISLPSPSNPLRLEIMTLSGNIQAVIDVVKFSFRNHLVVWLPKDCYAPPNVTVLQFAEIAKFCIRDAIISALSAADPEFPRESPGFSSFIQFTPIVDHGEFASCWLGFPRMEMDVMLRSWWEVYTNFEDPSTFCIGRWSSPAELRIALYMTNVEEEIHSIARCVSWQSYAFLSSNDDNINLYGLQCLVASPKLPVNRVSSSRYPGTENDTTLVHLLLYKCNKHFNYKEFASVLQAFLAREDIDFSCTGWSRAMNKIVSARELCFFEWCRIACGLPGGELWIPSEMPRRILMSMCVYQLDKDNEKRVQAVEATLLSLMENEKLFTQHWQTLRACLLEDIKGLGNDTGEDEPHEDVVRNHLEVWPDLRPPRMHVPKKLSPIVLTTEEEHILLIALQTAFNT